jgi:hypothetical protein
MVAGPRLPGQTNESEEILVRAARGGADNPQLRAWFESWQRDQNRSFVAPTVPGPNVPVWSPPPAPAPVPEVIVEAPRLPLVPLVSVAARLLGGIVGLFWPSETASDDVIYGPGAALPPPKLPPPGETSPPPEFEDFSKQPWMLPEPPPPLRQPFWPDQNPERILVEAPRLPFAPSPWEPGTWWPAPNPAAPPRVGPGPEPSAPVPLPDFGDFPDFYQPPADFPLPAPPAPAPRAPPAPAEPVEFPWPEPVEFPAPLPIPAPPPLPGPVPVPVAPPLPVPAPPPLDEPIPYRPPLDEPLPYRPPLDEPYRPPLPVDVPYRPPLPVPPPQLWRPPFSEPGRFNLPDPIFLPFDEPKAMPDPLAAKACPPCASVKREPKKKGTCRQGYFREYPDRTEYTTWSTRKCPSSSAKRRSPPARR